MRALTSSAEPLTCVDPQCGAHYSAYAPWLGVCVCEMCCVLYVVCAMKYLVHGIEHAITLGLPRLSTQPRPHTHFGRHLHIRAHFPSLQTTLTSLTAQVIPGAAAALIDMYASRNLPSLWDLEPALRGSSRTVVAQVVARFRAWTG